MSRLVKAEFFLAFTAVDKGSDIVLNCEAGFYATGLVLFDSQVVLSQLDVNLQTRTPQKDPLYRL